MTSRRISILFGILCCTALLFVTFGSISLGKKPFPAFLNQNESNMFTSNWNWGNYDKPAASVGSFLPVRFNSDDIDDLLLGSYDSNAYVIDGSNGKTLLAFSKPRFGVGAVAWGNFTGNSSVDLLIGATDHKAYLVNGTSHELLWQTPEEYPSGSITAVAGFDRNNDGRDEAFIASEDKRIYALEGDTGNLIWISDRRLEGRPTSLHIADVDQDGVRDIITGTDQGVYAFSGINGALLWYDESGLAVTDLILYSSSPEQPPKIIYSTIEGYITALNTSGSPQWITNASIYPIWDIDYGVVESWGSECLLAGSEDGNLYAVAITNGDILWSHSPERGPIVGLSVIDVKSEYWTYRNAYYDAALIVTRDGYGTCVYRDYYDRIMEGGINEWPADSLQTPAGIERIQAANLDRDHVTDFYVFLEDSSILTLSGAAGEFIWQSSSPKKPMVTMAVGENMVIAGSQDGGVYSIPSGPEGKHTLLHVPATGIASVIIRDIDQDGDQEILAGADNGIVALLDYSSWSQIWNTTVSGPVAVLGTIQANDDALLDVVVGSRDGRLSVLDGATGNIEWMADDPEKDVVSLGIDDFDGDGDAEITIGSDDSKIYCYDENGHLLWVNSNLTNSINRLTVSDLDNDGIADVAAGSYYNVSGVKGTTGEQLWRTSEPSGYVRGISKGDINGDMVVDVIVGTYESVYAIDGLTGETIWAQKAEQDVISVDSEDINQDGTPDFIVGTSSGIIYLLDGISGRAVQQLEAYHAVEVIAIKEVNDEAVELIFTDGSGIRSFYVSRIFPDESNMTNSASNGISASSIASSSFNPLISDSSSSFGWTIGIAIISLIALTCTRKRFKKKEM